MVKVLLHFSWWWWLFNFSSVSACASFLISSHCTLAIYCLLASSRPLIFKPLSFLPIYLSVPLDLCSFPASWGQVIYYPNYSFTSIFTHVTRIFAARHSAKYGLRVDTTFCFLYPDSCLLNSVGGKLHNCVGCFHDSVLAFWLSWASMPSVHPYILSLVMSSAFHLSRLHLSFLTPSSHSQYMATVICNLKKIGLSRLSPFCLTST